MAYERLKSVVQSYQLEGDVSYLLAGAASKLFATIATYPYQVVKTRMQVKQENWLWAMLWSLLVVVVAVVVVYMNVCVCADTFL